MLITDGPKVVNLNNVTEFLKCDDTIEFYSDITILLTLHFNSEESRDEAFDQILSDYQECKRVCRLD